MLWVKKKKKRREEEEENEEGIENQWDLDGKRITFE